MPVLWSVMRATWESTSYGCKCVTLNKYSVFNLLTLRTLAEKQVITMILCSIENKSSSPFLGLRYVFTMFLNFGHFSASRSYKKWFL